jgi:hypothetical protein
MQVFQLGQNYDRYDNPRVGTIQQLCRTFAEPLVVREILDERVGVNDADHHASSAQRISAFLMSSSVMARELFQSPRSPANGRLPPRVTCFFSRTSIRRSSFSALVSFCTMASLVMLFSSVILGARGVWVKRGLRRGSGYSPTADGREFTANSPSHQARSNSGGN